MEIYFGNLSKWNFIAKMKEIVLRWLYTCSHLNKKMMTLGTSKVFKLPVLGVSGWSRLPGVSSSAYTGHLQGFKKF